MNGCFRLLVSLLLFFTPFTTLSAHCREHEQLFDFIFSVDNNHWVGDFVDYPVGEEAFFELAWGWQNLPDMLLDACPPLTKGMILSGNNHSDDLFMFIRRQVGGLKPHTLYDLTFNVTIENNVPPGMFGIGGSPGESVFFKVGASAEKPKKVDKNGFYFLSVDKGFQSQNGKNAIVVGNLANPLVDPNNPQFKPKEFMNEIPLQVKSDGEGRLWLFVGTDSAFEGLTTYYVARIAVAAKAVHRY